MIKITAYDETAKRIVAETKMSGWNPSKQFTEAVAEYEQNNVCSIVYDVYEGGHLYASHADLDEALDKLAFLTGSGDYDDPYLELSAHDLGISL